MINSEEQIVTRRQYTLIMLSMLVFIALAVVRLLYGVGETILLVYGSVVCLITSIAGVRSFIGYRRKHQDLAPLKCVWRWIMETF